MPTLSLMVRNTMLDALSALLDGGNGRVAIYTGTKPANPQTGATGTLLAELTLPSDVAALASNGQITFTSVGADAAANNSGTPGWFRIYRANPPTSDAQPTAAGGTTDVRIDGTCSGSGGGGELQFNNTNFVAGGEVNITQFVLNMPVGS